MQSTKKHEILIPENSFSSESDMKLASEKPVLQPRPPSIRTNLAEQLNRTHVGSASRKSTMEKSKSNLSAVFPRKEDVSTIASRKGLNIKTLMDDVINEMMNQNELGNIEIPIKFWNFYQSDILLQFLKTAFFYSRSYIHLLSLQAKEREQDGEVKTSKAIVEAMKTQHDHSKTLAESYSKIVLHCSNFERQKEDESFFEAIFFFTCAVLKLGTGSEYWKELEIELGYIFRGDSHNVNANGHNREFLKSAIRLNFNTGIDRHPVSFSSLPFSAIDAKLELVNDRANKNIQHAQHIRKQLQENRESQIMHHLQKEKEDRIRRATQSGIRAPILNQVGQKSGRLGYAFSSRTSIRKTLNARSPVVSQILPTPRERVEMAQRTMEASHKRKRSPKQRKGSTNTDPLKFNGILSPN